VLPAQVADEGEVHDRARVLPRPADDAGPEHRAQRGEQDDEHEPGQDPGEEQEPDDPGQPEARAPVVGPASTRDDWWVAATVGCTPRGHRRVPRPAAVAN